MTRNAILCGLMLIIIGGNGYFNGTPGDDGKVSPTALIPAWFGVALILCGIIVALKESLRKHVMHIAALVGVIGIIGGLMPMYRQTIVKNLPLDIEAPAVRNGVMMSAICVLFVILCVNSFIAARKARQANSPGHSPIA